MFHIIYLSSAVTALSSHQLLEILESSRKRNESHGITGALFYHDGNVLQVIEGAEAEVRSLFSKIKADSRHRGITVLFQEAIPKREFAKWTMAFYDLDLEAAPPRGFDDFFNDDPRREVQKFAPKVKAFLRNFVR